MSLHSLTKRNGASWFPACVTTLPALLTRSRSRTCSDPTRPYTSARSSSRSTTRWPNTSRLPSANPRSSRITRQGKHSARNCEAINPFDNRLGVVVYQNVYFNSANIQLSVEFYNLMTHCRKWQIVASWNKCRWYAWIQPLPTRHKLTATFAICTIKNSRKRIIYVGKSVSFD